MKTLAPVLLALLAAAALAGCGSNGAPKQKPPLGSPSNPVPAQTDAAGGSENGATVKPGYAGLLKKQTAKPKSRFTPCNLVTKAQARTILRTAVEEPVEAPQGPTCVYRSANGRDYVTVAVASQSYAAAAQQLKDGAELTVGRHRATCGGPKPSAAQLYVALAGHRVLSISGPCLTAMKFASTAVRRLES